MSKLQKIEIAGDSSSTVTLPEHLIIDHILPRLPVKTLIRFKSVSKLWLSSISSPQFVKSHLNYSSSSSSGQFLIIIIDRNEDNCSPIKFMLLPYDELNNLKTPVDLGFPLCIESNIMKLDIVGSSNGLVCLHIFTLDDVPTHVRLSNNVFLNHSTSSFYVCNLATRTYCHINNPGCERGLAGWFWFGYIPSIDDHRIVSSFIPHNGNGRYLYVFSLRIGKWKIISDIVENFRFGYDDLLNSTTVVDDVLYWSPTDFNSLESPKRIIGLDLVNEQLKEAPLMDWLTKYEYAEFCELNGCLSLLCYYLSLSCQLRDVWTLRKQDDWSSWEKSFSFNLGERARIRAVTSTGKFLLKYDRNRLKVGGLNKDTQELLLGDDVYISAESIKSAIGYVESLISPFGKVEPNEEEDHEV